MLRKEEENRVCVIGNFISLRFLLERFFLKLRKEETEKAKITNAMQLRPMIDSDCEYEPDSENDLIEDLNYNPRLEFNERKKQSCVWKVVISIFFLKLT